MIEVDALLAARVNDLHHHVIWQCSCNVRHEVALAVHHRDGQFVGECHVCYLSATSDAGMSRRDIEHIGSLLVYQSVEVTDVVQVLPGRNGRGDIARYVP